MSANEDELDKRIKELEKLVEIKELEKSYAEAQKATIETMFPKGETKPLEGKITTDEKFGYIARLVSYQAMRERAKAVGDEINKKLSDEMPEKSEPNEHGKAKVLIVDKINIATSDIPLIQLNKQFASLNNIILEQQTINYELLREKEKIAPPDLRVSIIGPVIESVVGSIADIMGFFQVNYSFTGQEFTLNNDAVTAIVANSINDHETHILNFKIIEGSTILDDFQNFLTNKLELEMITDKLKHASNEVRARSRILTDERKPLSDIEAAIIESENIITTCNNFVKSITSAPNENSQSLLVQAALRNYIREVGITHLLYLNIVSSGGEAVTIQTLWPCWRKVSFIGGSAFVYILAEKDGRVVLADTEVSLAQLDYRLTQKGASNYKRIILEP